jgi:hypothetical protein
MQRVLWTAILALAVTWPGHIWAQDAESDSVMFENDQVEIEYVEPTKPELMPIYESMKELRVLEQLKQFLSPLNLPVKLKIATEQCPEEMGPNAFWGGVNRGLVICYQYLKFVRDVAPKEMTAEGYTRDDAITGMFLEVIFHELGHGMFDIYDIPTLGREEDGADQMAGFILSQFGPEVARRTLPGAAYANQKFYETFTPQGWPRERYSDVHGHDLQRAYNYLCIAYGSDPETFAYFVDSGLLPKKRAVHCKREADQLLNAFQKTMLPHIDPDKMKAVQEKKWLPAVVGL